MKIFVKTKQNLHLYNLNIIIDYSLLLILIYKLIN